MSNEEAIQPATSRKGPSRIKIVAYSLAVLLMLGMGYVAFSGRIPPKWRPGLELSEEFKKKHDTQGAPEEIRKFFRIFSLLQPTHEEALATVRETWQPGYEARLIEIFPVMIEHRKEGLAKLLEEKTGQKFGTDYSKWQQWLWSKEYAPDPEFAKFKHYLHRRSDYRFGAHFDKDYSATIRLDEIRWSDLPRDGVPPLETPSTLTVDEADYLEDSNAVFGVVLNGEARCYPKRVLGWHEMFKDKVGGQSICGVYCPLCEALIVYNTEVDGKHHELGISGFLYRSNKLMYDHETESLWSTLKGEPVVGKLAGKGIKLERNPVVTTTWGKWKKRHPDTKVLSLDTGFIRRYEEGLAFREYFADDELLYDVPKLDDRLRNKASVVALREKDDHLAISVDYLKSNLLHEDKVGDMNVVVLSDEDGTSRAFESGDVSFKEFDGLETATDSNGDKWKVTEQAITMGEKSLKRIASHRAFWFGWYSHFPQTRLVK